MSRISHLVLGYRYNKLKKDANAGKRIVLKNTVNATILDPFVDYFVDAKIAIIIKSINKPKKRLLNEYKIYNIVLQNNF